MQTFTAAARQRWAVIRRGKSLWGCVLLSLLTIALLRMRLPMVGGVQSDLFVRLWGMALQLIGAFTVLKDLTKTASELGQVPSLRSYIKALVVGLPPINGSANINVESDLCAAYAIVAGSDMSAQPDAARIAQLEREVKHLHGALQGVVATVTNNKRELAADLKARTEELHRLIGNLDRQLKDSLAGGFSMLTFGVFALVIGIVLTSIPVELATLFRLGELPRLG